MLFSSGTLIAWHIEICLPFLRAHSTSISRMVSNLPNRCAMILYSRRRRLRSSFLLVTGPYFPTGEDRSVEAVVVAQIGDPFYSLAILTLD